MRFCWIWILGLLVLAQTGCAGNRPMQVRRTLSNGQTAETQTVGHSNSANRYPLSSENRYAMRGAGNAENDSLLTNSSNDSGRAQALRFVANNDNQVGDAYYSSLPNAFTVKSNQALPKSNKELDRIDRSEIQPVSFTETWRLQDDEKDKSADDQTQKAARDKAADEQKREQEPDVDDQVPPRPPLESFETPAASLRYTLSDIEQIALANNPTLVAAQAAVCKAVGLKRQVGIIPNPTVGYFGQQLADQGTAQHGLFIEREFVRGDKLRLNRQILSHTTCAQQRELEAQQYRVLTDVRIRFYEAIAAQQQLEAAKSLMATARRGVEIAGDRLEAEEGSRIEVLQSETLLSEITLSVERTEIAYLAAWNDLAAIAGLPDSAPANLSGELISANQSTDWQEVYNQIVSQSPELNAARELVGEKAAFLRRQQVQAIPNITGQLGAGYDDATNSGMINVQVSAPIPVSNKNQGNISAANADHMQAVENVRRIEQSLKSRLARVAQDFQSASAAVKRYETEIIPKSAKGLELSEEAYKAGELDFLQVLILRRSYFESMIKCIEFKLQLAQATAKCDGLLLTGGLDAPQDFTDGDGIRGAALDGL